MVYEFLLENRKALDTAHVLSESESTMNIIRCNVVQKRGNTLFCVFVYLNVQNACDKKWEGDGVQA